MSANAENIPSQMTARADDLSRTDAVNLAAIRAVDPTLSKQTTVRLKNGTKIECEHIILVLSSPQRPSAGNEFL